MDSVYAALCQVSRDYNLPGLTATLTLPLLVRFLHLAAAIKPNVVHYQPPDFDYESSFPEDLPTRARAYLATQMGLSDHEIMALWHGLGPLVWNTDNLDWLGSDPQWDRPQGVQPQDLGFNMLYPPVRTCNRTYCSRRQLLRHQDAFRKVVLFTLDRGVCDAIAVNLTCAACNTVYKLNYTVNEKMRTYYANLPDVIQVAEHTFVERRVLELFKTLSLLSWTSATNAAHVYDQALSQLPDELQGTARYHLRTEHVWDGFVILSLLQDARDRQYVLQVPQNCEQQDRFTAAMQARNDHMRSGGQPEFLHCCDKCVRCFTQPDGSEAYVDAVITDGIQIGRPCCKILHCSEALSSTQDHYCPSHKSHDKLCRIEGCVAQREGDFRTCTLPTHRAVEEWAALQNKASFTLRRRLQRSKVTQPEDSLRAQPVEEEAVAVEVEEVDTGRYHVDTESTSEEAPDVHSETSDATQRASHGNSGSNSEQSSEVLANVSPLCPDGRSIPKRSLRAMFGRRRSHNEQLIVRPCGIIIRRETFFGSETLREVIALYKQTWPDPALRPRISLYDNNCRLYQFAERNGEAIHKQMGLPVDVFHWKSKHKKTDDACSIHCNPMAFPEIQKADGSWYFNSSIAEQTNVWLGGYHAIIREMTPVKYDFFLDEMIKEKNKMTRAKLVQKRCMPSYRPV